MLQKYVYSNRFSQEKIFYVLAGIVIPLSIATAILAWKDGNYRTVLVMVILSVGWSIGVFKILRDIGMAKKSSKKPDVVIKAPWIRRILPLIERTFWLLLFIACLVFLNIALVSSRPLYLIFEIVSVMTISGGHFLFLGLIQER